MKTEVQIQADGDETRKLPIIYDDLVWVQCKGYRCLGRPCATFGQKIRQYKLKLRKTRKQLAAELGISIKTLWARETDRWLPTTVFPKIG